MVPIAPSQANAGASHLPRENASVEAQVVGADSVTFLQQRQDIVQELAQHLVQRPAMLKGEFGFLTTADNEALSLLRVVQIGWAYATKDADALVIKSCLVKPEGFAIESPATEKHGIKHDFAFEHGRPLHEVLCEFLDDVLALLQKGYRICAHHLGFDAGILSREMTRAGIGVARGDWDQRVREGLCTMDPDICHWVRQSIGIGDKPRSIPMRLRDLVAVLLPQQVHLLARSHTAGADAHMHMLISQELRRRAMT